MAAHAALAVRHLPGMIQAHDHARGTAEAGQAAGGTTRTRTVISARRGWFDWRLRQLWRYRDLVGLFVWRDFVAIYKQTILGPAWHVIRPLSMTLIFTIVFGRIAGLSTAGAPPFLFYMVGNVAWGYFASSLDNIAKTFVTNAALLGKVYFHRLVIPLAYLISNLVAFGIQFGILLTVMLGYAIAGHPPHFTGWLLLLPVLLAILAGYSLGVGIIVCALTTRYRDMTHVVLFGIQAAMYVTPVIFPVSSVPGPYRWLVNINPLSPVFEGFRLGLLGVGTVTMTQLATSAVVMLAVLLTGLLLFSRAERTFMDTV